MSSVPVYSIGRGGGFYSILKDLVHCDPRIGLNTHRSPLFRVHELLKCSPGYKSSPQDIYFKALSFIPTLSIVVPSKKFILFFISSLLKFISSWCSSSYSSYRPGAIHPIIHIVLVQFIIFFNSSWCKIVSEARNLINSAPQAAGTTFAFSSVFNLLLWQHGNMATNCTPLSTFPLDIRALNAQMFSVLQVFPPGHILYSIVLLTHSFFCSLQKKCPTLILSPFPYSFSFLGVKNQ